MVTYVMSKKENGNVSLRGCMQLHMLIHAISFTSGIDIPSYWYGHDVSQHSHNVIKNVQKYSELDF